MTPELELRPALEEYKDRRLSNGELLEDVTEEIERVVRDKVKQWFDDLESIALS